MTASASVVVVEVDVEGVGSSSEVGIGSEAIPGFEALLCRGTKFAEATAADIDALFLESIAEFESSEGFEGPFEVASGIDSGRGATGGTSAVEEGSEDEAEVEEVGVGFGKIPARLIIPGTFAVDVEVEAAEGGEGLQRM